MLYLEVWSVKRKLSAMEYGIVEGSGKYRGQAENRAVALNITPIQQLTQLSKAKVMKLN